MQIQLIVDKLQTTVSTYFTFDNISKTTYRILIVIGAVFFTIMVNQKCNPMPKLDTKALKEIAKKQDSLSKDIAHQGMVLEQLTLQRDSQRVVDKVLLDKQNTIIISLKNLKNEYQTIKTFTLDHNDIYRYYRDSLKEYKPY